MACNFVPTEPARFAITPRNISPREYNQFQALNHFLAATILKVVASEKKMRQNACYHRARNYIKTDEESSSYNMIKNSVMAGILSKSSMRTAHLNLT